MAFLRRSLLRDQVRIWNPQTNDSQKSNSKRQSAKSCFNAFLCYLLLPPQRLEALTSMRLSATLMKG